VPVLPGDSEDALAGRVLEQEHRIYPQAIRWFCDGRLEITPHATVAFKAGSATGAALISPALEP